MTPTPEPRMAVQLAGAEDLTADSYEAIVYHGARVEIPVQALIRVAESRAAFEKHLATGADCYGVTTGMGALSKVDLSDEQRKALPRHTLLGRASGSGPALTGMVARGALLAKLTQFLGGRSAVSADLCVIVADRLNRQLTPFVPSRGFGMAGEIIPLSHAMQTLIGEGRVIRADGDVESAEQWHASQGIDAYEPGLKEGLSLISGTAIGPALAWHHARQAAELVDLAALVAMASVEGMAAPLEAYSPEAAQLSPDPNVAAVMTTMRRHLAGSCVSRQLRQAPVSFRVTPQVHAVAVEAINRMRQAALAEMRSNGDNPVFFAELDYEVHGRLVNSGNFHGAALAARVEAATSAIVHVGVLAEKRLYRLLDERATGLSPQLADETGFDAGLVTLHKAAVGYGASLRTLAAPVSVMQQDSSFGQEDVSSMLFPALERLRESIELTYVLLAHELYVAGAAIDQRGERPGDDVEELHRRLRKRVAPYDGDRSYGPDLDLVIEMLRYGR